MVTMSLTGLDDDTLSSMAMAAIFPDFGGKINSLDFHWKDDLLVPASDDNSVQLYDIASVKLMKTTYHKKHGADRVCFTHHSSSVICSTKYNLDSTGGHTERVVSLCMSPVNDSFMSGSLDHSVRIWDLCVNASQGILHLRGRHTVAYDQQCLVFAVAMEGGAIQLFDSSSYDKHCGFSLEPSPNTTIEATFTPDGQYVLSGSGDGTLHAWNINMRNEVACWNGNIGLVSCLKWAPRRAMFVAASSVLSFWTSSSTDDPPAPMDAQAAAVNPRKFLNCDVPLSL